MLSVYDTMEVITYTACLGAEKHTLWKELNESYANRKLARGLVWKDTKAAGVQWQAGRTEGKGCKDEHKTKSGYFIVLESMLRQRDCAIQHLYMYIPRMEEWLHFSKDEIWHGQLLKLGQILSHAKLSKEDIEWIKTKCRT